MPGLMGLYLAQMLAEYTFFSLRDNVGEDGE